VQTALAAHLVLEVFDCVGDEYILARDAGAFQRLIQEAAGGTNEGAASQVFLIAWLLADQHQTRRSAALARHNLSGELVEGAALTLGFLSPQRVKGSGFACGSFNDGVCSMHEERSCPK
jgi:hypothetical protein